LKTTIIQIMVLLTFLQPQIAAGAEIRKSGDGVCILEIVGPIEQGDYEEFVKIAKEEFPGSDGESTRRDIVCLNSPGGSLSEGVLFAKNFLKMGISTVVRANESCFSVCAIMFMMGSFTGDEVKGLSRKLHVKGTLGFHRPYLQIDEQKLVDVKLLALAYDAAFAAALDLISIANTSAPWSADPMMKSDLVEVMLSHIGNEFFYIDNVDKAGRWDIQLYGYTVPKTSTLERAFYSCENTLQWQMGTTKKNTALEFVYLRGYIPTLPINSERNKEGQTVMSITGLDSGYVNENCLITVDAERILGCGFDENTSVSFGSNECTLNTSSKRYSYTTELSQIYAWTTLKELALRSEKQILVARPARCFVFSGTTELDNQLCFAGFGGKVSLDQPTISFLWPSGSKTVLEITKDGPLINGSRAVSNYRQGFDQCFENTISGNVFCFRASK